MPMSEQRVRDHITQVRTIGIPVVDQDRALEFYVGRLGFEKRIDSAYGQGERWVEVAPRGAQTTIALIRQDRSDRVSTDTRPPPLREVRLTTEDAEAAHADLRARGFDVDQKIIRWGDPVPPRFLMRDPDGNLLLIVERGRA
jgi:catechol 2,3-dioxygenase-like lactoylglutathione lyase family enzyme